MGRLAIILLIGKEDKTELLFVQLIVTALVCLDTVDQSHISQLTTTLLLLSMPTNQRYIQYLYLLETNFPEPMETGAQTMEHGLESPESWWEPLTSIQSPGRTQPWKASEEASALGLEHLSWKKEVNFTSSHLTSYCSLKAKLSSNVSLTPVKHTPRANNNRFGSLRP